MVLDVATLLAKENFLSELQACAVKRDWKKILKLSQKYGFEISSIVLWVFPSEYCLEQLKITLKNYKISNILSIGCGIGLLEFIMRESIGVRINGLEIDSKYWSRKKPFIPLRYVEHDQEITPKFLLDTVDTARRSWNFTLLFCYFNLRRAFNEYIKAYRGNYVIIIGPCDMTGRYTDPLPLDFQDNDEFQLVHTVNFGDNRDLLAIYERKVKTFAF